MPQRSGQYFDCAICGEQFYRKPSHVLRGITKTCGKTTCKSAYFSGENNPFWEKEHTPEIREQLSNNWSKNHRQKPGPKPGFKHTKEARQKITASVLRRWKDNRDEMLTYARQGLNAPRHDLASEPRHRVKFTGVQKKLWIKDACFYCNDTTNLVLDHIIPASCGGKRVKTNTQTLCQPCNQWKMRYVDLPLYFAMLDRERG